MSSTQQLLLGEGAGGAIPVYIEDVFSCFLYTGNGSTQTITNNIDLSTNGGIVWCKGRSPTGYSNVVYDTINGVNTRVATNLTNGLTSAAASLTAFNTTGFSLGADVGGEVNENAINYVSWTFREQPKFFDIVTYSGTGIARTIAHNLGSVPGCIIVKDTSAVSNWYVYHRSLATNEALKLNSTAAIETSTTFWNNTAATSSVFSLGTAGDTNGNGDSFIAYVFAHDAGGFGLTGTDNVISCGTFTVDGSGDCSVSLGYEPQWIMVKSSTATDNWYLYDNMRGFPVAPADGELLRPTTAGAGITGSTFRPTSTGFTGSPGGGFGTGIYIAIRRGPMKVPTVGTSVFNLQNSTEPVSTPIFSAGTAPPDVVLNFPRYNGVAGPFWLDRLRGNARSLTSATTAAETSPAAVIPPWFFNTEQRATIAAGAYYNNSGGSPLVQYSFIRAPSFFDEVCYSGNSTARTINHNLGVAPELMIVKVRSGTYAGSIDWFVYASPLGNTSRLLLDANDASAGGQPVWNSTTPTSSVFSLGTSDNINGTGYTYVNYLFATCAGVSKVGSYTGTGALQTVNCGFAAGARFVFIKRTDSTGDWYTYDSARGITSGNDPYLLLNSSAAEVTGTNYVDTDTTGFQVTAAAPAAINANGGTYIFLAIA